MPARNNALRMRRRVGRSGLKTLLAVVHARCGLGARSFRSLRTDPDQLLEDALRELKGDFVIDASGVASVRKGARWQRLIGYGEKIENIIPVHKHNLTSLGRI